MEPEASIVPWLVPLFPLIGFLIIAFFGRGITGAPKPVVEADPHGQDGHGGHDPHVPAAPNAPITAAVAHNAGPSDAPEFVANPGVTAAGHDDPAPGASDDHGHGGHGDVHLNAGGTKLVGGLATVMVLLSFLVSCYLFLNLSALGGAERRIFSTSFEWMPVPAMAGMAPLNLHFQLAVDPLTCLMLLVITGVGTLIHLYSTGYMSHDVGYARYFGYLNLFVFFMLLLVMGANFLVMFVGWEGVGLASYLLIGFWYTRRSATDAGKKAFIVNRVGDFAFLLALFLVFRYFGTFDFYGPRGVLTQTGLNAAMGQGYLSVAGTLVPLFMFIGATGKSAQIPLYVWLPDAMEGPTPVSALIHAATMVTAGVYMVCRAHLLFLQSPEVMTVVAVIGLSTAFMAATIGLVQNDIKRVLAYSTVSQLGYMFLACGVGAFGTAMFHVTTHAFFKALLFLGSGSVIHAMSGEQDMRNMGGLGKIIKTTWATMLIGTLAISGIPIFAGFFSKDEILANAFASSNPGIAGIPAVENGMGHPLLWLGGWIVAGMTAFYMVRMMMKTFAGQPRMSKEVGAHIHESPPSMTIPLILLAILSTVGGFMGGFAPLHIASPFEQFLGETVEWRGTVAPMEMPLDWEWILVALSVAIAVVMCLAARALYLRAPRGERLTEAQKQRSTAWRWLYNKYYVDELYNRIFVRDGKQMARWLWRAVDVRVIDGLVNGVGGTVGALGGLFRRAQTGYVRNYALTMLLGVVVVVAGCLYGMAVLR